jgi:hypothetical protein
MFLSNTFHQYDVLGTSKSCDRYVVFFSSQTAALSGSERRPEFTQLDIYGNMQTYRYFYIYTEARQHIYGNILHKEKKYHGFNTLLL